MSDQLVKELLDNPQYFSERGKGNELLQRYFGGYPIKTLIPLLKSNNEIIQKEAIWIVSELGSTNCNNLLEFIIPLLTHSNAMVKYFALDSVFLGTYESNFDSFVHLISVLDDADWFIQKSVMHLLYNANLSQLKCALKLIKNNFHIQGIELLLNSEKLTSKKVIELLNDNHNLIRKYGAVIAKKIYNKNPKPINYLIEKTDHEMNDFATEVVELLGNVSS